MTTAALEKADTKDYSALLQCDAGGDWLPTAYDQIASWLREKSHDVDLKVEGDHSSPTSTLDVRHLHDAKGHDVRVRLTEANNTGRWMTEIVLHDGPGTRDWIGLTVRNAEGSFVSVPRVARYLLQVLPLRDGRLEFTDQPQLFRGDDVPRLIDSITDDQRHGLIFVAGTSAAMGDQVDPFANEVGKWAREVYGLAQVIVLDPSATDEFNRQVGRAFEAPPWSIRTYQPNVLLDVPDDGRRHRFLGTRSLADLSDRRLQQLLGSVARRQAAMRPKDTEVERVKRRFERHENHRLVAQLAASETAPPQQRLPETRPPRIDNRLPGWDADEQLLSAQAELRELAAIRRLLNVDRVTVADIQRLLGAPGEREGEKEAARALQARVDELQLRVEGLEDRNTAFEELLSDEQMATEVVRLDLDDREAKIRWLESRLKSAGDYEALYATVPDEFFADRPATFDDLLSRIEKIACLEFTGDPSHVAELNSIDTNNAALRVAWDATLTMIDYAKARAEGAWDGSLDQYLKNTPSGFRTFPTGKFAHTETSATMTQHGAERRMPVPTSFRASGFAVMKAHFKLAQIGMTSPRMYVLDAHPSVPCLFIGYLGPHLTNTQTN